MEKKTKPVKIALIGMMGTGKTAVGPVLAQKFNVGFADLDDMIVARVGMSIAQTFITYGEKIFRQYETSILSEVVWHDEIVISCGGGVPLNMQNMELMNDFFVVRLTASAETIHERIKDDFSRPLINDNSVKAIQRIIADRESVYSASADLTVINENKTVDQVAEEIYSFVKTLFR